MTTPVALRRAPWVDLDLGEKYKLAYDFKAVCLFKEKTGKSLLNGDIWENIEDDPETVLALVWAGLQLYHPELTIDDVSHLVISSDLTEVISCILLAWKMVRPKVDEDPKKGLPAEPAAAR